MHCQGNSLINPTYYALILFIIQPWSMQTAHAFSRHFSNATKLEDAFHECTQHVSVTNADARASMQWVTCTPLSTPAYSRHRGSSRKLSVCTAYATSWSAFHAHERQGVTSFTFAFYGQPLRSVLAILFLPHPCKWWYCPCLLCLRIVNRVPRGHLQGIQENALLVKLCGHRAHSTRRIPNWWSASDHLINHWWEDQQLG